MRYLLELLGVAVFAVSGVLAARRKKLDVLGIAVIAVVTAIGGGTLRDLLLDRHPIFWIANTTHLWVILGATAVTLAYVRFWIATQRALLVADALGLAFFTIAGLQITEQAGYSELEGVGVPPEVAALAGMGIIAGLRLAAILWRLELPVLRLPEDDAG